MVLVGRRPGITFMAAVALVACVAGKLEEPAAAEDLYTSVWFRYARAYAIQHADRWFVLSAKHGLVRPDQRIGPYDETLVRMAIAVRRS